MWASTLWPLLSSTRNMALGRASTTVPSISITPSFLGMSSAFLLTAPCSSQRAVVVDRSGTRVTEALRSPDQPRGDGRTLRHVSRLTSLRQTARTDEIGPVPLLG